jgi:uncharacterized cofD-like protein
MRRVSRVVALGGGTGLPVVLSALKPEKRHLLSARRDLAAIVTVTDDGGSSGRLRKEMGALPPGDLRNCLVALSDAPEVLRELFQYRFEHGELEGHSMGNLFIAALAEVTGDFASAARHMHEILAIRGTIYPSTPESVQLVARFTDGSVIRGEAAITGARKSIRSLALDPADCSALPEACEALRRADLIILGPGSVYTSILPNLLVRPLAQALRRSRARKVYLCNLATQPGETDGYTASRHLEVLFEHIGPWVCDAVLCNTRPLSPEQAEAYRLDGAAPVTVDEGKLQAMGLTVVGADLLADGLPARHDPDKLKAALLRLAQRGLEVR